MAEQLCWSCSKACGGSDCPWANKLKPVEGWKAKKRIICGQKKPIETYHITKCPLYEKKIKGSDIMAAKYKGCMSFEQTEKAWNMQKNGKTYIAVAMEFQIDVATLYRSYQHYGFQPPKHQNRRRKK